MPQAQPPASVPDRVRAWNDTSTDYPRDALVPRLFRDQAERSPDAPAVAWDDGGLTYAELDERVRRAAARLRDDGVGDGDVVAVPLERSPQAVVAILAVLEAGGVYLPMDPAYPRDRLRTILERSGAVLAVTSPDSEAEPVGRMCRRVTTEDLARHAVPGRDTHWAEDRRATDPAYVIYTSGTTGAPKGVLCPHRGPVRLVTSPGDLRLRPDDRLLATTSPTFDVSCFELFAPLLNGACLVLPAPDALLDTDLFESTLRDQRITVLWLSAGLFHQYAEERPEMFAGLRLLIAGGDVLNPTAVRAVLEKGRPEMFLDGYGPTENSTFSTTSRIEKLADHAESVPIGRPVPNSTAYVVGEGGRLTHPGEVGELWVGGDGVALEYLGDQAATESHFVPDPFGDEPGARLYRTGDRACLRRDGVLEFRGRRDRQVKIRGYRVELDEIEGALSAHPQVEDSAVDVVGEGAGQRLAAAVVPVAGADTDGLVTALVAHTKDRLPTFMVPTQIATAEEIPLQTSGKVDRERLLDLVDRRGEGADTGTGGTPSGSLEEAVADVWCGLLGIDTPGREDDFFALGGTSLRATQVAAATCERVGIPPASSRALIRSLLGNPTLAAFARHAGELRESPDSDTAEEAVDFAAESVLDPELRCDAEPAGDANAPRTVLLTGGTGFLGVYLLDRLISAGVERVYCLTRARTAEEGSARIHARMRRYGLDPSCCEDRITPVPGELSEPRFGLDTTRWEELAREVELIVHGGSQVNFAYPYRALAPINVGGTRTVLRLATAHSLKPVHYVSTIAVLAGFGTAGVRHVQEDTELDFPERIALGYPETKWVAERLVARASERGLPVAIHRPYEITGAGGSGVWNTDTMMCALFRTIAETGIAPDIQLPLDFVPVDCTADAITHILTHQRPDGRVYHLTNPRAARLGLLVDRLRAAGYGIENQPYDTWVERVTELTARNPEHPMAPFLPMFIEPAHSSGISANETYFTGTYPEFGRDNVDHALQGSGITCPPVDERMIDLYLRYFRDSGYLAPPERRAAAA
ncbi:amino acid adenylation domain-containing protein [Streptomyces sp. NPDC088258]|uniref:amino acid adenylation domain-containing protein n=1 Tax=Streptomyces sp. NPDC088258 TaxID=3365849 RepID=UPI0038088402